PRGVCERTRGRGRVQRRYVCQREWPVPRLPHHADGDGGAAVLHSRGRVRRGDGDLQPDGHAAGPRDDDHHAAPDHEHLHDVHHHDLHAAPDHDHLHDGHDHHAAADHDHPHDVHDHHAAADHDHHDHAAVVDHPHGVPHRDGEHRLVEHQDQLVGPVHQPHAAADRRARGAVLQPANMHPSLPNYLWLEAGTNFNILDDNDPSSNRQST